MSNTELQVIDSREVLGREFKIYGTIEEPLFLAKDIANWLEHSNITMMLRTIDEEEQIKIRPKHSLGLLTSNNEYNFLTEYGLYEVLMQSRKPIAKAFKKEVKQILKALRLNQIKIVNTTNETKIDTQIIDSMNRIINIQSETINLLTEKIAMLEKEKLNQNDKLITTSLDLTDIGRDEIEKEILSLPFETLTLQSVGDYLNNKNVIKRTLGIQIINQLLRDNNILNEYNTPLSGTEKYFIKDKRSFNKVLANKKGIILIYRLALEQITEDYQVRR